MSFVTVLALGVALLIAAPTLAHLLRRGRAKEEPFPAASLVPVTRATARERSRLEDRGVLLLRALSILCLALLGAGPLVRCSRVALGRSSGASVAIAIVVDDSASMRTTLGNGNKSRFQRAVEGARELLASAREGDAIALIQAGKPARLTLAATTDLHAARRAVDALTPSDRGTELGAAVELGRAALGSLPHQDKRVVLLSDLAGDLPEEPGKDVWAALPELATQVDDCGILRAEQSGQRVSVAIACSTEAAARGRVLKLSKDSTELGEARLVVQRGEQVVVVEAKTTGDSVKLAGSDPNPSNDQASVAPESRALSLAVHADAQNESVATGGAPVLEQALHALGSGVAVRPLPELPREASELADVAALFIDDAPGLTPETRSALDEWLASGAVATLFLGSHAGDSQLGATLEPFVRGAVHWEPLAPGTNVDVSSLGWLGTEAESLKELAPKGRARFDSALLPGAEVVGRWSDGKVLLTREQRGRGVLFTVGLPLSVEVSDLPLRPAFLALLDHMVSEALRRRGPRASEAGTEWWFPANGSLQLTGPDGPLTWREADGQRASTPETTGRYEITLNGKHETRFITLPAEEVLRAPKANLPSSWRKSQAAAPQVDASPELGWLLLGLLAIEVAVRIRRLLRERHAQGAIQPTPS